MVSNQVTSVIDVKCPRRPYLDPAHVGSHGDVVDEFEAEDVDVEVPGPVLVGDREREELHAGDGHFAQFTLRRSTMKIRVSLAAIPFPGASSP